MGRKILTEEERIERKRERDRRWYAANKERLAAYGKQYRAEHKSERAEYYKQYYQANREKERERNKQRRTEKAEYMKQYRANNPEYDAAYNATPMGRARRLVGTYRQLDKRHNRGDCTLTSEWVISNIFSQPCHYCGESDWTKIGCDRIDNSLPHTPDNVVPCCCACNKKRGRKSYDEFMQLILN